MIKLLPCLGEGTSGVAAVTERLTIEWDIFFSSNIKSKTSKFYIGNGNFYLLENIYEKLRFECSQL